jgi:RNA polymerase primary sigma factor
MALHYKYIRGISIPDLVSEGKIGLLKAFDKFDKGKNLKFITYAVWWIKSKIGKYIEDNDLIRLPTYQKQRLNREKKHKEIKNLSKDMYYLHEITNIHLSLNDCIKGSKMPIAETIKDDRIEDDNKIYFKDKWKESLKKFLSEVLTEEEFIVITNLYGINTGYPISLRDVKDIVDKSHERVRQIRDNALRTLRKSHRVEDFKKMLCGG